MNKLLKYINNFFTKGNERSIKAKKNTLYMFFIQGVSMLISLLLVPMTLDYVDPTTYGVWITLSSMIVWIRVLDIGINNGLRNKLTQAFANKDFKTAKKYVSTTYAMLTMIFIPIMVVLLFFVPIIDWYRLLNLPHADVKGLAIAIAIVISQFCLNFILSTINIILVSDQNPASAKFRSLIQQIVSLIIIFILIQTTKGSLVNLCAGLCIAPLVVVLIFNITLFTGKYKSISPTFKCVDFKLAPSLLSIGLKFFIIQIGFIVQYQISNFLILRYYGPEDVTSYNIAFKYFNTLYTIWIILISPIWAATSDAITKGEYSWVKNTIKKYTQLIVLFILLYFLMLLMSTFIYDLWLGEKIIVPVNFSFWIMMYNIVICFGAIYINVLNGAGILKVQTISSIFSPIVFILTFIVLNKMGFSVIAVPIAGILSSFNGLFFAPIQCYSIFFRNKRDSRFLFK